MICHVIPVLIACVTALSLPGTGVPPCTPGENVMVTVVTHDLEPIPGVLFEVEAERRETACVGPEPVRVVPVADYYPTCVLGMVQGPDLPPTRGACCGEGCSCAGTPCEHIPMGGPPGYEQQRLRKMAP